MGLWISDHKERYDYMHQHKDEIETEMGAPLWWKRLDNKKASTICTYIQGLDFGAQDNYPRLMNEAMILSSKCGMYSKSTSKQSCKSKMCPPSDQTLLRMRYHQSAIKRRRVFIMTELVFILDPAAPWADWRRTLSAALTP